MLWFAWFIVLMMDTAV